MRRNADSIRQSILEKHLLPKDAAIGIVSSTVKEQRVDKANRDIIVVATTTDIDMADEVVVSSGADTSRFFKLRNIFLDHCYDFSHCVGKLRSAKPRTNKAGEQDGWICRIHITDLPNSPFPNDILALAEDGGISTSIGFRATDFGRPTAAEETKYNNPQSIVRTWEWLELSVTMFPCNLSALQLGMPQTESGKAAQAQEVLTKRHDYLDRMLKGGRISEATAKAFGLKVSDRAVGKRKRIYVVTD